MAGGLPERVLADNDRVAAPYQAHAPAAEGKPARANRAGGLLRPSQLPAHAPAPQQEPRAGRGSRLQRSLRPSRVAASTAVGQGAGQLVRRVLSEPGRALSPPELSVMGSALGADFSAVRIHDDQAAAASARAVGAGAYTSGVHVVAGDHHLGVETATGRRSLAHELYHVLQQSLGPVAGTETGAGLAISHPSDPDERAAARIADSAGSPWRSSAAVPAVAGRQLAAGSQAGPVRVQRMPMGEVTKRQQDRVGELEQAGGKGDFTTVGFEWDIGQLAKGNVFEGISHVELAEAIPSWQSRLQYLLETDANNILEFVTPPFLVATVDRGIPLPDRAELVEIIDASRHALLALVSQPVALKNLLGAEGWGPFGITK